MIDPFAEMVDMMRTQGAVKNTPSIQLATMTGARTCTIGTLPIMADDLYIPDRLLSTVCTKVNVPESHTDKSSYSSALKSGDIVAIVKLSDAKYIILDRVVSGV